MKFCCKRSKHRFQSSWVFLLLGVLVLPAAALAQATAPESTPPATSQKERNAENAKREEARARLEAISLSIGEKRQQLEELRQQLAVTKEESEKKELQQKIDEAEKAIKALQTSFEAIATGGVDIGVFSEQQGKEFDWRSDLLEILKPIFEGLKDLTEKPRMIERLRSEIAFYENQLAVIKEALANIDQVKSESLGAPVARRLEEVEAFWQQRKNDAQRELDVVRYQLENIREKQTSFFASAKDSLSEFFKGRGLTLLLAILATVVVWFLLQALLRLMLRRHDVDAARVRTPYSRLLIYGYRILTVLLSLLAFLLVLYVSGDWLLLGLALIVLVAAAISFKNHLPRFASEAKLMLNLGAVREGERVIYNGVSWRVRSINVYSILHNPELHGGIIRLPLSEMANLISRPYHKDEPWFPSRTGDFMMLSDGTYGQVLKQTPEVVQLKAVGSTRTFATADYLGLSPRNLSLGSFGVVVTFGIDYRHQAICLEEVPAVFKEAARQAIAGSSVGENFEDILVEFKEAGASSLDYLIYVAMNGAAAGSYWTVGRIVQQACVKVCNDRGWIIPFAQLTVHQGEGFEQFRIAQN